MKKLILIFLLFPSLLFAQKSTNQTDFITVTIKIIRFIDDTFVDVPFTIENSEGQQIMNSETHVGKEIYQKMGEGQYQVFLKAREKYQVQTSEIITDCEILYEKSYEEVDLSNAIGGDEVRVIIRLMWPQGFDLDNVNFHVNKPKSARKKHLQKAILSVPKSIETCNAMFAFLTDYPKATIQVKAHTDSTEPNPEKLSKWRALAVKNYLIERGISPERIEIESFGSSNPLYPNDSAMNRALNRRAEFRVFKYPDPCTENE